MVESAESFGKYTLIEKVAAGGMAEIFRAKTVGLGGFEKLLAIKRLHPQFSEGNEVTQMLVDEARIAVHLTHPNIAQVFDLGRIDEQYFIAMEFIEGVDLHQANKMCRERGASVPAPAVVFAMAEALAGLHYAHTRTDAEGNPLNIVHRDVSPQNIMISFEGEVKLVDFGIAKAEMRAQQDTQHGIIKGKFYYMAPEQAHGHHVDPRTDVFAAGMVLYELLVGQNPYAGIEEYELLKAVRKADFAPVSAVRPDVDPELEAIVSRATRRDASYRFESAREMRMALINYLDRQGRAYRRSDLADFVRSLDHRQGYDGLAQRDDSRMSRDDFEASDDSMIFDAGAAIGGQSDGLGGPNHGDDNPFGEEEPTQLWSRDDAEPDETRPADSPSELSSPQFLDIRGFGGGAAPAPKPVTSRTKLPLIDRLFADGVLPDYLHRPHMLIAGIGLCVVVLAGILTYLIASGGDDEAPPPEAAASAERQPAEAPARPPVEARVDFEVTSTPEGAEVYLDDDPVGQTPLVIDELSAGKSYDLVLSKVGYERIEATIEPSADAARADFELEPGGVVLKVSTYPPDANVSVDGRAAGRAPVGVGGLSRTETHEVVVSFEDGRKLTREVRWKDGDERVKEVEFKFDDAAGADRTGEGNDDPKARSRTKKRRRPTKTRRNRPRRTSSSSKKLDLFGSQNDSKGSLDVRIRGEGKVYVDGRLLSSDTDRFEHSLAPGSYQVKVYFTRLKRYSPTKKVRVKGGETSRVHFSP